MTLEGKLRVWLFSSQDPKCTGNTLSVLRPREFPSVECTFVSNLFYKVMVYDYCFFEQKDPNQSPTPTSTPTPGGIEIWIFGTEIIPNSLLKCKGRVGSSVLQVSDCLTRTHVIWKLSGPFLFRFSVVLSTSQPYLFCDDVQSSVGRLRFWGYECRVVPMLKWLYCVSFLKESRGS